MLCADLNAHTAKEPDFCIDDDINDYVNLPVNCVQDTCRHRNNQDLRPLDTQGKQILALCKATGLRIINGRTLGDTMGHFTCFCEGGDPSVIDYMLASERLLSKINYFWVKIQLTCQYTARFL